MINIMFSNFLGTLREGPNKVLVLKNCISLSNLGQEGSGYAPAGFQAEKIRTVIPGCVSVIEQ
jgi:hypothetical protein